MRKKSAQESNNASCADDFWGLKPHYFNLYPTPPDQLCSFISFSISLGYQQLMGIRRKGIRGTLPTYECRSIG